MKICYSDRYMVPLIASHPFPMPKYKLAKERLLSEGTITHWHLIEPGLAAEEDILLVHTADYWLRCERGELGEQEVRRIGFPWSEGLVRRSRASVQGTIIAARNALRDDDDGRRLCQKDRGHGRSPLQHGARRAQFLLKQKISGEGCT